MFWCIDDLSSLVDWRVNRSTEANELYLVHFTLKLAAESRRNSDVTLPVNLVSFLDSSRLLTVSTHFQDFPSSSWLSTANPCEGLILVSNRLFINTCLNIVHCWLIWGLAAKFWVGYESNWLWNLEYLEQMLSLELALYTCTHILTVCVYVYIIYII